MNTKSLPLMMLLCAYPFSQAIEPISLVAGPAISAVVKGCGDRAWDYIYATQEQEQSKQKIKKHLSYDTFRSAIAKGCSHNFTYDCVELAQYLQEMEKHYAHYHEILCVTYQYNIVTKDGDDASDLLAQSKEIQEKNSDKQSYFCSLLPDKQKKLLAVERKLVIEYAQQKNYLQELQNLHRIFTQQP